MNSSETKVTPAATATMEASKPDTPTGAGEHQSAPRDNSANPDVSAKHSSSNDLKRVLNLRVPVTAVLAERDMNIEAILAISVGTIIEFEVPFDSDLTLCVANRTVGSGQAVKVGENFGMRIGNIDTVRHRIDAMGGK